MTNPHPADLQELRVLLWWQLILEASGLRTPNQVEYAVRKRLRLKGEVSHILRPYAKGKPPFLGTDGPRLLGLKWPPLIESVWPMDPTLAWLTTPFWYLLEHRPDSSMLLECVNLLPEYLREDLLAEPWVEGEPVLSYLIKEVIYELALDVSPMGLGALGCAMHRARISGQADIERLSTIAQVWMVSVMCDRAAAAHRQLLEQLLHYILLRSDDYVYVAGHPEPLKPSDIQRFGERLEEHANWTVEARLIELGVEPASAA